VRVGEGVTEGVGVVKRMRRGSEDDFVRSNESWSEEKSRVSVEGAGIDGAIEPTASDRSKQTPQIIKLRGRNSGICMMMLYTGLVLESIDAPQYASWLTCNFLGQRLDQWDSSIHKNPP